MEQIATSDLNNTTTKNSNDVNQHKFSAFQDGIVTGGNFEIWHHTGVTVDSLPFKADYYTLAFCIGGRAIRTVNQFRFEVAENTLHLTTPQSLNSWHQASDDLELYIIHFKKDFLADGMVQEAVVNNLIDHQTDGAPICMVQNNNVDTIRALFEKLNREFHSQKPFHRQMLKLMFFELLFEANRIVGNPNSSLKPVGHPNRPQQLVNHFKKLVEQRFAQLRTVQEYADLLFVTAKHLSEVVKHESGLTALQIIHQRVYQEAKYLLCATEMSIKEIAERLNFDTSSHFSRFFKHFEGYNPTDFQRVKCAVL
ncbi:helix-turn-helix domain-containing protein [Mucilaginibacter agri]|uniref:Helix-turn-helix domain-containing protein n=1 Tax=Mucilaginibacter agri TaxID=2695265 RepID=A0A966DV30_9SPHI|nr:helix-turn-helix transcriptional regulator [Mucilaginibacter agri]NCD71062.1 helix-turn-helix domain-containing protein [Mucilaginibacter agri]